jgi:WD40 repeat protein
MTQRLRIFISSPNDVPDERLRSDLIIDKLSQDYSRFFAIESYRWEHEAMLASKHFQDAIEPPSAFDIVVLILWSRLGTPLPERTAEREYRGIDGRVPVTGTEWEYEEALQVARQKGTPDLLAFRNVSPAPIDPRDAEAQATSIGQLAALNAFWTRHFTDRGMFLAAYDEYCTLEEFARRLEESLRKLIERRVKDMSAGTEPLWLDQPFRGLESYEFEHAPIFFGRDAAVMKATEQLAANARAGCAFLLISGPSGSGKSSLVKAGVVPRLMKPQRISGAGFIRRCVFRPAIESRDVFLGLATALTRPARPDGGLPELIAPGQDVAQLATHLRGAAGEPAFPFVNVLGHLTDAERKSGRLLAFEQAKLILVVDQFEELFTGSGISHDDGRLFVQLLAGLARSRAVWVIATLRADFWHRAAEIPDLIAIAEGNGRIDLPAASPAELAEIIRKPAQAAGLTFELHPQTGIGLDAVLAQDAASAPGALPLLSFTLDELYKSTKARGEAVLTHSSYEALGGLEGAIANRADEIVAGLPGSAQVALPRVLRALTTVSGVTDQIPVARSVPLESFAESSPPRILVNAFVAARLLVAGGESVAPPTVRLAHEALISRWTRAREQLLNDRRDLETRELVERQRERWRLTSGRAQRQLLLRDPDLANAVDLGRRWGDELDTDTHGFIQASRTSARLRQQLAAVAAAIFALVALGAAYAAQQASQARRLADERSELAQQKSLEAIEQRELAEQAKQDALKNAEVAQSNEQRAVAGLTRAQQNESLTLSEQSLRETDAGDSTSAMRLALSAMPKELAHPDRPLLARAEFALTRAVLGNRTQFLLRRSKDWVNAAAYNPDNSLIATGTRDGVLSLWDATTGKQLRSFSEARRAILAIAFSPDGKLVATSYVDPQTYKNPRAVVVRIVATGEELWDIKLDDAAVSHLFFSPDGGRLITVNSGNMSPRVWDLKTRQQIFELDVQIPFSLIHSAALSRSGKYLVTAMTSPSGDVFCLWDVETGKTVFSNSKNILSPLDEKATVSFSAIEKEETIFKAAFMGDTDAIVLRGKTTIYILDPEKREITAHWQFSSYWNGGGSDVMVVSPDGASVVVAISNTELALYNLSDGKRATSLRGHTGRITHATFSPDGAFVTAAADDLSVRTWQIATARELHVLRGHKERFNGLVYSADGRNLLTFGGLGTRVWDVRPDSERLAAVMPGPNWRIRLVDNDGAYALLVKTPPGEKFDEYDRNVQAIGLWAIQERKLLRTFEVSPSAQIDLDDSHFAKSGGRVVLRRQFRRPESESAKMERARLLAVAAQKGLNPATGGADIELLEVIDRGNGGTELVFVPRTPSEPSKETFLLTEDASIIGLASQAYGKDEEEGRSEIEVWDCATARELLHASQAGHSPRLLLGAGDGILVLATKLKKSLGEQLISTWSLKSGAKLTEFRHPKSELQIVRDRILLRGEGTIPSLKDLSSGQEVGNIASQALSASDVRLSSDQEHMLVGRENAPWSLWHLPTQRLIAYLPSREARNSGAQFSGDGRRIITRFWKDRRVTIDVFQADTGDRVKQIGVFADLNDYYIAQSGNYVALNIARRTVEIHDVEGTTAPRRIKLNQPLRRLRFVADDQRLVTVDQDGALQIWDCRSGALITQLAGVERLEPLGKANPSLQHLPVVLASGGALVINTISGQVVWQTHERRDITKAELSPDEKTILVVERRGMEIYEIGAGEPLASFASGDEAFTDSFFTESSDRLLIHLKRGPSILFNVRDRVIVDSYQDIEHAALLERGKPIMVLARGKGVEIRDVRTGMERQTISFPAEVHSLHLSQSGNLLAVVTNDFRIATVDIPTAKRHEIGTVRQWPQQVYAVDPDCVLVHETSGELSLRQSTSGKVLSMFPVEWLARVSSREWGERLDPTGTYVAVRSPDQFVRIFRTADGSLASSFNWDDKKVAELAFTLDGQMLVAVMEQGNATFWNIAARKPEKSILLQGQFSHFQDRVLQLSSSGSHMSAIDGGGGVHLISLTGRNARAFFIGRRERISDAALSPDGSLLATISNGGTVRVWHVGLGQVMIETSLSGDASSQLRYSDDSQLLIAGRKVLQLPPVGEDLVREANAIIANLNIEAVAPPGRERRAGARLGIVMMDVKIDQASAAGLPAERGVLIKEVLAGSAAMNAGIRIGDTLVEFNGKVVASGKEVEAAVAAAPAYRTIPIVLIRNGKRVEISATLGE